MSTTHGASDAPRWLPRYTAGYPSRLFMSPEVGRNLSLVYGRCRETLILLRCCTDTLGKQRVVSVGSACCYHRFSKETRDSSSCANEIQET